MLNTRIDRVVHESMFGELHSLLSEARRAMRLADYSRVQSLLEKSASIRDRQGAEYQNLLGAMYEGQKKWRLAERSYKCSLSLLKNYEPAKLNLQRLIQLRQMGSTSYAIQLGDEQSDVWYAQVCKG